MRDWKMDLQVRPTGALLLVTSRVSDVLKANLPLSPSHPRALLTMLEGLALWCGQPLEVVVSAPASSADWLGSGLFGDELFPAESPLVRFRVAHHDRRARRLAGIADFRSLRRSGT